ncbi:uncharacterized protein ACJ7VT_012311 [Polymixia lowei]
MSLSTLLLLLLVYGSHAAHLYGTVMTFHPRDTYPNGSVTVVLRYRTAVDGGRTCPTSETWTCSSGVCGTQLGLTVNVVHRESRGEWCQGEGILTRQTTTNAPFQLTLSTGNWFANRNSVSSLRALTLVDLRTRSDTGQANRSPQTTIIPSIRVPSNCQRNISLLTFDPDGDRVTCRYASSTPGECANCLPPPVLTVSAPCTLSFPSTTSSNEGSYAVQLVMEDFPSQSISLTHTDGSQTSSTTSNPLSKVPVQFVFKVDPVVPSCTEGQYLPRFVSPTPAHGERLYVPASQTEVITIKTEATNSPVSELLFSGPYNLVNQTGSVSGEFRLSWTPSQAEDGEHHPICFIAQAILSQPGQ